ncbi:MAG: protein kinase domain-containing protein [Steroidobacteraceae bacterium]
MPQVRAAAQPTTLGRYTLIERIGTGGQGEVWRAHDESRGVDIALKILAPSAARNPAAWEALEREHGIASRLQHPGILQVLAPERLGNAMVLPMELASGGDLRRLRGVGYLEIVPVLLEVAEALEYAHARSVVHRDLKPGNVLFDTRGRVKLADFGIAALLPAAGAVAAEQRGAGHSPFTASPEQLRGEPPSPADDIYGLGALAYELLSGHPPYYPNFDFRRAQTQPVPELVPTRQVPPELGQLVMRMLAKGAAERPASMQQVMDELDATLNATLSFAPEGAENGDLDSPQPEAIGIPQGKSAEQKVPEQKVLEQKAPERKVPEPRIAPLTAKAELVRAAPSESRITVEETPTGDPTGKRPPPPAPAIAPMALGTNFQHVRRAPTPQPTRPRPITAERGRSAAPASLPTHSRTTPESTRGAYRAQQPTHDFIPPFEPVSPGDPFDGGAIQPRLRGTPPAGTHRRVIAKPGAGRARHWPYLVSGLLCGAALICGATAAVLFWLPRYDRAGLQRLLASIASIASPQSITPTASDAEKAPAQPVKPAVEPKPQIDPVALARFNSKRADFDKQAAALAARGVAAWDGSDFSAAKMQAAQSSGAAAAGGLAIALQHLSQADQLLANAAHKAPQALAAELRTGDAALLGGHQQLATQDYALARRIDPNSGRAINGTRRARLLSGVLPLLTDAHSAELAHNYSRAVQDYSQALALDPGNTLAKAGLGRANAAFGDDNYARSVGAGFAALGAGQLTEARTDFQRALALRPQGTEAAGGLERVSAALQAGRIAALRQRAASLEEQEHWQQAIGVYDTALREDPSLAFARRGKARDEARAALSADLQQIIDRPERLSVQSVRDEAVTLLQQAREATPSGPVLQAQTERLGHLLPQLDRPVLLNLISDNSTQVTIPSLGAFGTFGRREIRLKPGTYTVIGTRDGYRAVHQEFTVEPGQQAMTITVSCSEPI